MLRLDDIHEKEGFIMHCKIAAFLIREFGKVDPAAKHHIRDAVREATKKVTTAPGNDLKAKATSMSHLAAEKMRAGDFQGLVAEHAVPVSIINERVLDLNSPTHDQIALVVLQLTELAVITAEEHHRLSDQGLSKSMPDGWNGLDPMARYRAAGIQSVPNEYKELRRRARSA